MNIQDELNFIRNVEKYPSIYDSMISGGNVKKAFEDIAENIDYNYPEELRLKWGALRKKYIKLRNLDPSLDEKTLEKNAEFLKAMSFLDDFDLDEPILESPSKDSLRIDDDDPHYEDSFIAEVKKYPILFNTSDPDNKKTKLRQQVWEQIGAKFGMNEKKLQLKWKNLKRKYILMRFPQSSKNAITQKRKIKYSQKFVDKLQFLDKYLEHARTYEAVQDPDVYENEIKRIKLEYQKREPGESDDEPPRTSKATPSPAKKKVVFKKERPTAYKLQPKITIDIDDEEEYHDVDRLKQEDPGDYEEFIEDEVDYLADTAQQYETEDSQEASEKPNNTTDLRSADDEESGDNTRSDNKHFCLSLVEPLSNLPFAKQVKLKNKIWNLLAESYSS